MKSCPGCEGLNIRTELWGDWFATACQNCHWQTGFHNSEEESERSGDARATDPLLKEMAEALDVSVKALKSYGLSKHSSVASAESVMKKYHEQINKNK